MLTACAHACVICIHTHVRVWGRTSSCPYLHSCPSSSSSFYRSSSSYYYFYCSCSDAHACTSRRCCVRASNFFARLAVQ